MRVQYRPVGILNFFHKSINARFIDNSDSFVVTVNVFCAMSAFDNMEQDGVLRAVLKISPNYHIIHRTLAVGRVIT